MNDEAETITSRFALTTSILPPRSISTPVGAAVLDDDLAGKAADELDIRPLQRRPQIGVGGGPAAALADRLLHQAEAFLLVAVIVVGRLEAGLLAGLDEGVEQRVAEAGRAGHAAARRCRASLPRRRANVSCRLK